MQEVKSKSIEDEAKKTDAQKPNAKGDSDVVKVYSKNIYKHFFSLKSARGNIRKHISSLGRKNNILIKQCTAKFLVSLTVDCLAYLIVCHTGN